MISKTYKVFEDDSNKRIDKFITEQLDYLSRGIVQRLISEGSITVAKKKVSKDYKITEGEEIEVNFTDIESKSDLPQKIDFRILDEQNDFLILDKPAGLTVHPGAGQKDNTLINGLLYKFPDLGKIPRNGLIHRLDKDTSGLIIIAKTLQSHTRLTKLIQSRLIKRRYLALVHGVPIAGKTINKPIGRHPKNRLIFCVKDGGRESITHFKVRERFDNFSLLEVSLETGRTHQIRVHLKFDGHPICGDRQYNKITKWSNSSRQEEEAIQSLKRQALHAFNLSFNYDQKDYTYESPMPLDLISCIRGFKKNL